MSDRASGGAGLFALGWTVIGLVFGGLFTWSYFAPFEGAVMAAGVMTVESNNQAIQHLEGGIVSEILIEEGDRVEKGDALIRLEGASIEASLTSLEARLFDLYAREARLSAERSGGSELDWSEAVSAFEGRPALEDARLDQEELLDARRRSRATKIELAKQRISQLDRQIIGLTAELDAKTFQADMTAEEIASVRTLVREKLAPKSQLMALERERAQFVAEREALAADIAAARIQISETRLEIVQLTDGFREEVVSDLADVRTEIAELSEQRRAALDRITRLEVRAPRGGWVIGVRAHTVGGVVAPGDPLMHIVPDGDRLLAVAQISSQDIDKVAPGQEATLRFSAFSSSSTPEAIGKVLRVSADAFQNETTGASYYEGVMEIVDPSGLPDGFRTMPGMPVDVLVKTESRNVLSYLTKPLRDAMARTFRE